MLITSFYCVAGKQYFYAKICSQKRATLAMQQDDGTAGLRDYGTTGLRDNGTTGRRDDETTRQRDNRKTQAFSGILRHSQSCEAAWRQSGAAVSPIKRLGWMDSTERTFHSAQ